MSDRGRASKRKIHKHVAPTRVAEMLGVVGHSYTPNSESSEENEETYARARAVQYPIKTLQAVEVMLGDDDNAWYEFGGVFADAIQRGDFQTARALEARLGMVLTDDSHSQKESWMHEALIDRFLAGGERAPVIIGPMRPAISFAAASRALGNKRGSYNDHLTADGYASTILPVGCDDDDGRRRKMLHYIADAYDAHQDAAQAFIDAGLFEDADEEVRKVSPAAFASHPNPGLVETTHARAAQLQRQFDAFNKSKARHLARTWQPANSLLPQGAGWLQQQFLPFFGGESIYRPPKAGRPRLVSPPPEG